MKTTVELPEEVIQRAKIAAIQRKTTLKDLILRSLVKELDALAETSEDTENFVAAFSRGNNSDSPVGKILRDKTDAIRPLSARDLASKHGLEPLSQRDIKRNLQNTLLGSSNGR